MHARHARALTRAWPPAQPRARLADARTPCTHAPLCCPRARARFARCSHARLARPHPPRQHACVHAHGRGAHSHTHTHEPPLRYRAHAAPARGAHRARGCRRLRFAPLRSTPFLPARAPATAALPPPAPPPPPHPTRGGGGARSGLRGGGGRGARRPHGRERRGREQPPEPLNAPNPGPTGPTRVPPRGGEGRTVGPRPAGCRPGRPFPDFSPTAPGSPTAATAQGRGAAAPPRPMGMARCGAGPPWPMGTQRGGASAGGGAGPLHRAPPWPPRCAPCCAPPPPPRSCRRPPAPSSGCEPTAPVSGERGGAAGSGDCRGLYTGHRARALAPDLALCTGSRTGHRVPAPRMGAGPGHHGPSSAVSCTGSQHRTSARHRVVPCAALARAGTAPGIPRQLRSRAPGGDVPLAARDR